MPNIDPIKNIPGRPEIEALYATSIRRLKDIVGSQASLSNRTAAASKLRQINGLMTVLNKESAKWSKKYIPEAYRNGTDQDADVLKRFLGGKYKGSFNQLHKEAAIIATESAADDFTTVNEAIRRTYTGYIQRVQIETARQAIANEIAGGIIEGASRETVSSRLLQSLSNDVNLGMIQVGKVTMNATSYADLLARTLSRAARTEGTLNRLTQNGIDLVIINNTGAVDFCRVYEDQIFSLSGRSKLYPKLTFRPPYHPNCTHIASAFITEFADDGEIERGSKFKAVDLNKGSNAMAKKYPIIKDDTRARTKKTQKKAS